LLLASNWADKTVILRLAGIYGPGRLPRWRDLAAGRPLTADPHGVLNLIHVDDAVRAVERAATISDIQLPGVFLISDGHPVRREEFYAELARLLQLPLPEFVPPGPGQRGSQRGRGQKKVSNERMIKQLGVVPLYSSYREGLAAIADS
jgi:nucleoside-diphosphate-sugar epimerase